MNLYTTGRFEREYKKLPPDIKSTTKEKLKLFVNNISHPSLRVKKIKGTDNIWEVSITMNYRFTFEKIKDGYLLRNIGPHDKTLKNP